MWEKVDYSQIGRQRAIKGLGSLCNNLFFQELRASMRVILVPSKGLVPSVI